MSNWERRPLRLSQQHYAALDAYILVRLISKLQEKGQEAGFPLKLISKHLISAATFPQPVMMTKKWRLVAFSLCSRGHKLRRESKVSRNILEPRKRRDRRRTLYPVLSSNLR